MKSRTNAAKRVTFALLGTGVAAAIFGGWNYREAAAIRATAAASAQEEQAARTRVAELEIRLRAREDAAKSIESDNALLAAAIENVRAARATVATPISSAEIEQRVKQAIASMEKGDAAAALGELLWCYDVALPQVKGTKRRQQMSAIGSALAKLAESYPPAQAALRERFDKARQRLLASADETELEEIGLLGLALQDGQALISTYDQLPANDPRRRQLGIYAFEQFVAAKRYAEAAAGASYATMSALLEAQIRLGRRSGTFALVRAAMGVEVLAGTGDLEHARKLALRILEHDDSVETRAQLQKHLTRAGHPDLLNE